MHQTIIVLNSPTAVKELIDRLGASTANRPASIIADMITPDNLNIGTGRFGMKRTNSICNLQSQVPVSQPIIRGKHCGNQP